MLYYLVSVGSGDALPFFRLHLPVLPFVALWAGRAVAFFASLRLVQEEDELQPSQRRSAGPLLAGAFVLVLAIGVVRGVATSLGHPEFRGVAVALERSYGAVGELLEAEARAGERRLTALIADAGMTPWRAPSVRFVDVIGLTDRTIAHLFYANEYTPYVRHLLWREPGGAERITEIATKLFPYLEAQEADFIVVGADCKPSEIDAMRAARETLDEEFFRGRIEHDVFYHGLPAQPQFRAAYRLRAAFEFSPVRVVLLYGRVSGSSGRDRAVVPATSTP
jgi:hypothetical protein